MFLSGQSQSLCLLTSVQGLPYKYVVKIPTRAFSEAPPAIMDALNHLDWAGQNAIKDGSYQRFNELLCLGYMEQQKIRVYLFDLLLHKLSNRC